MEAWFDHGPNDLSGFDLVCHHQFSRPHSIPYCLDYYTILIDLIPSPADLLAGMHNGNAQQIRRAIAKDRIQCCFNGSPDRDERDLFQTFFNDANGPEPENLLDRERLEQFAEAGMLALSKALTPEGTTLVWHAYICHPRLSRARCDLSTSIKTGPDQTELRNLAGRANRLLHYQDMLALQTEGIRCYDFGGWYPGTEDLKRLGINRFKEGFGGTVVREYESEQPLTLLGRLYLHLRTLKWLCLDREQIKAMQRRRLKAE